MSNEPTPKITTLEKAKILNRMFAGEVIERQGYWITESNVSATCGHFLKCKTLHEDWNCRLQSNFFNLCQKGIPPQFRWRFWKTGIINIEQYAQNFDPGFYREAIKKTHQWTGLIRIDVPRTFPEVDVFDEEAKLMLSNILNAMCIVEPQIGYCQGMNFVAAFILLVAGLDPDEEENCFWFFVSLMDNFGFRGLYREKFPLLRRYTQAFDLLVERRHPIAAQHLRKHGVSSAMFIHQWYLTLFVSTLPLAATAMMWDYFLSTGTDGILVGSLALFEVVVHCIPAMTDMELIINMMRALKVTSGEEMDAQIGYLILKSARGIQSKRKLDVDIQAIINVSSAQLDADVRENDDRSDF